MMYVYVCVCVCARVWVYMCVGVSACVLAIHTPLARRLVSVWSLTAAASALVRPVPDVYTGFSCSTV